MPIAGGRRRAELAPLVHLVTAALAVSALVLQLVLVVTGSAVLAEGEPPSLPTRLGRLVCYFTIQSNLLVAVSAAGLVRRPDRDGVVWRVVRLAALGGITVTGLVHFVLLRPLLDLTGWDAVADGLLHVVVPLAALAGWLLVGPRPRVDRRVLLLTLWWPLLWLGWTLIVGAVTGWYPYPFLDVGAEGWPAVLVTCAGVMVLFVAVLAGLWVGDRRLRPSAPARRAPRATRDAPPGRTSTAGTDRS